MSALLFLLGGGNGSAHTFDSFAPRFTQRFHVLGLTRRGQAPSDRPIGGYDTDTLARDIRGFLDALHLERVVLLGHSIAGAEMTRFEASTLSALRLVYLDSALDYRRHAEISAEAHFGGSPPDTALGKIEAGAAALHPDFAKVRAPALAFVVVYDEMPVTQPQADPTYKRYVELLYQKRIWLEISERFISEVKNGRVIQLHHTNHNFFKDPAQVDGVVRQINAFLLETTKR